MGGGERTLVQAGHPLKFYKFGNGVAPGNADGKIIRMVRRVRHINLQAYRFICQRLIIVLLAQMPQHYGSESIVEDFIEQAARVFIRQMPPGSENALLQVIGIAAGL